MIELIDTYLDFGVLPIVTILTMFSTLIVAVTAYSTLYKTSDLCYIRPTLRRMVYVVNCSLFDFGLVEFTALTGASQSSNVFNHVGRL